ncbi:MAG: hypothetical protein K8H88_29940, partial [Sandaracinaceae bacterium]|nr:hypothetical protein [Sandaracinaceae bacterium]
MAQVLVVSKPLAPPWNDGSKNLARDLVAHLSRYEPVGLSDAPDRLRLSNGRLEAVYAGPGAFAPSRLDQARVLRRLLLGRGDALWHFFFAPNPASSRAARTAARLRGKPTVHT